MRKALHARPRAPRGYDHTQPAGGPGCGERTFTPVDAGAHEHTSTQSGLHGTARGLPQCRVGWSLPPAVIFSTGWAGTTCGDRPAAGQAGPRLGSASAQPGTGLPTREKERKREIEPPETAVTDRGRGRDSAGQRRAENRKSKKKRGTGK